jgi:uncharacterized membrane protein
MGKQFKKLFTFLIYGFVFWLPVILVVYIAVLLSGNAESAGRMILGTVVPDQYLFAGFGIIFCLLIVFVTGILLKLTKLGVVLSKIPVIGLFFGQGEIMTIGRLSHMQACLFLYSPTTISYAWILSEEKVKISEDSAPFSLVNVYFPNTPTLVTGQVFATRRCNVMKLNNSSSEIINLMLYAFRSPSAIRYLPWDDESTEAFQKRAKFFGLPSDSTTNSTDSLTSNSIESGKTGILP